MSKLATPPHAINFDMSQVIDDATCRGFVMEDVLVKGLSRGAIATG